MRMTSMKLLCGLAAVLVLPSLAMAAAGPVALESTIKIDKLVTENGVSHHVMVQPQKVVPGNHVIFLTNYHNTSAKAVDHFVVTNPLPQAVVLESTPADGFEVSVDGGKSWGLLAALKVSGANGVARSAQAGDVTHVRWVIASIAPGASGSLEYHAVVR